VTPSATYIVECHDTEEISSTLRIATMRCTTVPDTGAAVDLLWIEVEVCEGAEIMLYKVKDRDGYDLLDSTTSAEYEAIVAEADKRYDPIGKAKHWLRHQDCEVARWWRANCCEVARGWRAKWLQPKEDAK
jgi:hypothetical protein